MLAASTTSRERCRVCHVQAGSISQGTKAGTGSGVGSLGRLKSLVEDRQGYDPAIKC